MKRRRIEGGGVETGVERNRDTEGKEVIIENECKVGRTRQERNRGAEGEGSDQKNWKREDQREEEQREEEVIRKIGMGKGM